MPQFFMAAISHTASDQQRRIHMRLPLLLALMILLALQAAAAMNARQAGNGSSIEKLWAQASQAQQAQQYARAASFYRQILELNPGMTEAEVNLGLMLHLAGNRKEAIQAFEQALASHPDLFAAQFLAGMDSLKLGDAARALPHLERAQQLHPEQVEVRIGLANCYLQLERYAQALDEFNKATALDSKSAEAWYGLGATYLSSQKQIESEMRRQPPSAYRGMLLGESYLEQGQTEKAIATLSAAVSAQPALRCGHSILGFAYLKASKSDDAARQFALDWNSAAGEGCLLGRLGEAALAAAAGKAEDAARMVQEVAAIDANVVPAAEQWLGSDLIRSALPNPDAAPRSPMHASPEELSRRGHYTACSEAVAARGAAATVNELKLGASCSFYSGRDQQALRFTAEILKKMPGDAEALYWRIQAMEHAGLAALGHGIALNPASASLHALMGDMLRMKGDDAGAADEYAKAVAQNPDFIAARLGLARSLNSDRKAAEAEQQVKAVLQQSPDDAEANYLEGEILVGRSDFAGALPFLLKALRVSAEELPYVHADLAAVYENRGETEKAIGEIRQSLVADTDGSYYYRLGRLYAKAGNRAAANEALEKAAQLRHATDAASQYVKTQ